MPFKCYIGGVDLSAYFKGMTVEPSGDSTVGSATIYIDADAGGGITIKALQVVQVWQTYNAAGAGVSAKGRLFGGLVKSVDTSNAGTTKLWTVECWDNNAILHLTVRDAQAAKVVHLSADTFAAQIRALVETVQRNGYGAVNSSIDAATGVEDFYATMPEVTYPGGHELGWYIRELCLTAQALTSSGGSITGSPTIVTGGTGYPTSPTVTIEAPPAGGVQATATAHATAGVVDSVTITNAGSGYPTAPTVSIEGGGLVAAVVTVAVTALVYTIRPAYYIGVDTTFGAGEVFGGPVLWIYDGALTPTPDHSFSDVVAGGRKAIFGEFRVVKDASMPIVQRQQATFGKLGAIVTSQDTTSQSTYPYPYINHGGTSNTGYAMLEPLEDTVNVTYQDAQAALDRVVAASAYPRATYTFATPERVLPGETIGLGWTLEGIADDTIFRVAKVTMTVEPPDVIWSQLTVNTRRLGLFDEGDDIFAPPIEGDRIGPLAPASFALNYNLYNATSGMAELGVTIGASTSPDVVAYRVLRAVGDQYVTEYEGSYLSPTIELLPGLAYELVAVAVDVAGNPSVPCTDVLTGTAASPVWTQVPNPSFEQTDRFDTTKPAYWTRTVVAGGTATLDTTAYDGTKAIKLLTAGGVTDSASFTSDDFMVGPIVKRPFVFFAKASFSSTSLGYTITWKDSAGSTLGTSTGTATVGTSWARFSQAVVPTAACVKASIKFTNSNTPARTIYVDLVSCESQIDSTGIEDGAVTGPHFNSTVTLTNQTIDFTSTSKITAGGGKVTVDANGISVGNSAAGTNNIDFYNEVGTRIGRAYSSGGSGDGVLTIEADYNGAGSTSLDLRAQDFAAIAVASTSGQIVVGNDGSTDGILLSSGASTKPITMETGSVLVNSGGLATTATDGFLYMPSCAGVPTGTPTTHSNGIPMVYDRSNNNLYAYNGGAWKKVTLA